MLYRHAQGVAYQFSRYARCHRPAYNFARVQVQHNREIKPTCTCANIGNIGYLRVKVTTGKGSGEVQDEVKAQIKARDLSEQAYKAGSITLTDELDADRQLLLARDELITKQVDTARAAIGVFRAFDGGWDAPANLNPDGKK